MCSDEGSRDIPLGQEEEWKGETLSAPVIGPAGFLPFFHPVLISACL